VRMPRRAALERIANWFLDSMDQISGWYKRRIQFVTLMATLLTLFTNVTVPKSFTGCGATQRFMPRLLHVRTKGQTGAKTIDVEYKIPRLSRRLRPRFPRMWQPKRRQNPDHGGRQHLRGLLSWSRNSAI
jgi:hypothetical protein